MTAIFDVGDNIRFSLDGKIIGYTCTKDGDCYTIEIDDDKRNCIRVYLDTEALKRGGATKSKGLVEQIAEDFNNVLEESE